MTTPIRPSEATLIEVRQALQRVELFRRQITDDIETPLNAHTASVANPHTVTIDQAVDAAAPEGGVATPLGDEDVLVYDVGTGFWRNRTWAQTPVLGEHHVTLLAESEVETLVLDITTITADTTLTTSHTVVLCDATAGAITVTLPAAASNTGRRYFIKKLDSSGNSITIEGNASETIDNGLTAIVNTQYETLALVCDGSNWHVI